MALQAEDVAQHSYSVAVIAHALCVIDRELFGKQPDEARVVAAALLHDASECLLTDVISPVKKYSPEVEAAFNHLEKVAERQLLKTLPEPLQPAYQVLFDRSDPDVFAYVHAADKLDALCKCKMEVRRGNQDFAIALGQIAAGLEQKAAEMPCVRYFLDTFIPAFERSVDEYRYLS